MRKAVHKLSKDKMMPMFSPCTVEPCLILVTVCNVALILQTGCIAVPLLNLLSAIGLARSGVLFRNSSQPKLPAI